MFKLYEILKFRKSIQEGPIISLICLKKPKAYLFLSKKHLVARVQAYEKLIYQAKLIIIIIFFLKLCYFSENEDLVKIYVDDHKNLFLITTQGFFQNYNFVNVIFRNNVYIKKFEYMLKEQTFSFKKQINMFSARSKVEGNKFVFNNGYIVYLKVN